MKKPVIITKQEYRDACRKFTAEGLRPAQVFQRIKKEFPDVTFTLADKKRIEGIANYWHRRGMVGAAKEKIISNSMRTAALLSALAGLDKALSWAVNENQLEIAKKILRAKEELQ